MPVRKIAVGTLAALVVLAGTAAAQPRDPVREAVAGLVAGGFPAAVAYVRDGARVRHHAAGVADTATGEPASRWHRFRIASNTKAFTATVLLQLVGEGRLSLSDTVDRLLPGMLRGNGYQPELITVRQLLQHASGVYDPADTPEFFAPYLVDGDRGHVIPPAEVVRRAVAHGPAFTPGTDVAYSNTNYLLLGVIIERITGRDVVREIRHRILRPRGLRHTTFPIVDPHIHGPHLHGYDLAGTDLTVFSPSYDWTAGAMISTVDDLARFQRALLGGRLLAPAEQRELLRANEKGYGLGLESTDLPCADGRTVRVWGYFGTGPGYTAISLSTADGRRQLVLAATVFDLAVELAHDGRSPWPVSLVPATQAALCPATERPAT